MKARYHSSGSQRLVQGAKCGTRGTGHVKRDKGVGAREVFPAPAFPRTIPRELQDERGGLLIVSIIILLFLAVLGMSLISFLFSRTVYSQMELDRLKALYLAEAGISKAIWELRYDIDLDGNSQGNVARTELGDGSFWARHDFQNSTITATGVVNKARRVIQMKYSAI